MKPDYDEQLDMRRWPVADDEGDGDMLLLIGLSTVLGVSLLAATYTHTIDWLPGAVEWLARSVAGLIAWGGGVL